MTELTEVDDNPGVLEDIPKTRLFRSKNIREGQAEAGGYWGCWTLGSVG